VVRGKCREVGDEKEVEEELDAVCFVALREDERVVVCADEGGFDPGGGVVQALEVLFFVAAAWMLARKEVVGWDWDLGRTHRAGKC
jgi:hypothetical protein